MQFQLEILLSFLEHHHNKLIDLKTKTKKERKKKSKHKLIKFLIQIPSEK